MSGERVRERSMHGYILGFTTVSVKQVRRRPAGGFGRESKHTYNYKKRTPRSRMIWWVVEIEQHSHCSTEVRVKERRARAAASSSSTTRQFPNASRMHMHLLYNVDWSILSTSMHSMLYLSCARMHRSFSGYQYIIFSDRKIYIIYLFQPNLG
jgi:hypothetical protein